MANNSQVHEKVERFLITVLPYCGKEITLQSGQHFSIEQICDKEKEAEGTYSYSIQYGFPQSGCVCLEFDYSKSNNEIGIHAPKVYAPPASQEMTIANFAPQVQEAGINISINFGMNNGTILHSSVAEIEGNPNALKMLDLAIADLAQAQILGECRVCVPVGSERIPCCNSTRMPDMDFPSR